MLVSVMSGRDERTAVFFRGGLVKGQVNQQVPDNDVAICVTAKDGIPTHRSCRTLRQCFGGAGTYLHFKHSGHGLVRSRIGQSSRSGRVFMSTRLEGKVALITGAARGQGRSHAVRLASEGADIIAVDIVAQIESVPYALATVDDLKETKRQVDNLGRRIVTAQADVRDFDALRQAVDTGVEELGRLDFIIANAGVALHNVGSTDQIGAFIDTLMINLVGVRHTVHAGVQHLIDQKEGGAIVLTSSTQGLNGRGGNGSGAVDGYVAAKHGVVGLMRSYANWLGPHSIRVNSIHPSAVDTPMAASDSMQAFIASEPENVAAWTNLLPVMMFQPEDVSGAVAWLVSDDAKYISGVALPVDGGNCAK